MFRRGNYKYAMPALSGDRGSVTYARRTDSTQADIAATLQQLGHSVHLTHREGHGFPDIVSGKRGRTHLIECKSGHKASYTPDQIRFMAEWRGAPIVRLDSVEDTIKWDKKEYGA